MKNFIITCNGNLINYKSLQQQHLICLSLCFRVMYFSIHLYEYGLEWPCLRESDYDFIGTGKGLGYNINVPLNKTGCDNSDYMAIFQQILLPIAYEFCPELVLVSAGYDAAIGCPEGQMDVTPAMYSHFTNLLSPLAGGKICLIQEVCLLSFQCLS